MEERYYQAQIAALNGAAAAAAAKATAEVAEKRAERAARSEASLRRKLAYSSSFSSSSSSSSSSSLSSLSKDHDHALVKNLLLLNSSSAMRADLEAQSARQSAADLRRLLFEERDAADVQGRGLAVATRLAAELPSVACRLGVAEHNLKATRGALADAEDRCLESKAAAEKATERAMISEAFNEELRRYMEGLIMGTASEGGSEESLQALGLVKRALSEAAASTRRRLKKLAAAAASAASAEKAAELRATRAEEQAEGLVQEVAATEAALRTTTAKLAIEARARQTAELAAQRATRGLAAADAEAARLRTEGTTSLESIAALRIATEAATARAAEACDEVEAARLVEGRSEAAQRAAAAREEALRSHCRDAEKKSDALRAKVATLQKELAVSKRNRRRLLVFPVDAPPHAKRAEGEDGADGKGEGEGGKLDKGALVGSISSLKGLGIDGIVDEDSGVAEAARVAYVAAFQQSLDGVKAERSLLTASLSDEQQGEQQQQQEEMTPEKGTETDGLRTQLDQLESSLRGHSRFVPRSSALSSSPSSSSSSSSVSTVAVASGLLRIEDGIALFEYDFAAPDLEHHHVAKQAGEAAARAAAAEMISLERSAFEAAMNEAKAKTKAAKAALKKEKVATKAAVSEIKQLRNQINRIAKGRVADMSNKLVALTVNDERLHELVAELTAHVKTKEGDVARAEKRAKAAQAKETAAEQRSSALRAAERMQAERASAAEEESSKLQERIESMSREVSSAAEREEALAGAVDSLKDELREASSKDAAYEQALSDAAERTRAAQKEAYRSTVAHSARLAPANAAKMAALQLRGKLAISVEGAMAAREARDVAIAETRVASRA